MTPIEAARQAIELRKKATDGTWDVQFDAYEMRAVGPTNVHTASYMTTQDAAFIAHAANTYAAVAEALDAARTALREIIELDHHNHAPESRATTMARAAFNAMEKLP